MLNALKMLGDFDNIVKYKDVTKVQELIDGYTKILPILLQWRDYFRTNAVVDTGLTDKVTYEMIVLSIVLFLLTIFAIYKLIKSLKFINRTLHQLSYVTPNEYSDIKNKIVSARKYFGGIDLTKRGTIPARDKQSKGTGNKRRIEEAKTNPLRRTIPIFLLFSFYMVIQGAFKAVEDSTSNSVKLGMNNVLFYANDEANAMYGITQYKNYTLYLRAGQVTDNDTETLGSYLNARFDAITQQYTSAVDNIQQVFPTDQATELINLIYGNTCLIYEDTNCTNILSGTFEQGLITGRIAIINGMIKDMDQNTFPITKYWNFHEFNQADDLAHLIQLDMLTISSIRILDILSNAIITLAGLLTGLAVVSLFFFRMLWSYIINDLKRDFNKSRQLLSLLPVLYIHKNSRIMAFLKQTSTVSLGKYEK
eukprot:CAMPEP_0176459108 /NCGR_PEP_ID=MMETSP0127-20121128/33040_1 /TAXON_ID=938130 /ORGANISM="Platyophrya macrostoma, Strain WH" /LENGTH=421 /DNA_ID=CAMNT_0017849901 /DNA_START=234 /DNA_END=1499 /DNA_ORIENTATION=-